MRAKIVDGVIGNTIAKERQEWKYGAARRLLLAFLAVLVIATLYGYVGIQFASAQGAFIPS